jgi:cation:H+ antiporter
MLLVFTLGFYYIARDLKISPTEGALSLLALTLLFGFSIVRSQRMGYEAPLDEPIKVLKNWVWDLWYLVAGVAALMGGSHLALQGGISLGEIIGLSERVIGITIISAGTGLPELATSAVAAYRGRDDIAVANVIGSNIMNTLGILGVASLFYPISVSEEMVRVDMMILIAITATIIPIIALGKNKIRRPVGVFLLFSYVAYLYYLLSS